MAMTEDEIAEDVIEEFKDLSGARGTWEAHWQEVAEKVLPSFSNTFNTNSFNTPGEKKTQNMYDSTATIALKRFGAILDSLLTPRNATWHRIIPSDPQLAKDRQTRLWFEEVNRLVFRYRYAPKANFASQNQQNFLMLGGFGNGCVFADALDSEPGIRYRALHLGEVYFAENHQGIIDTAYRRFELTARQAYQKWGDKLPETIRDRAKDKPRDKFWFIHCVKPRHDYDPQRLDHKGMPFAAYYVAEADRQTIVESGYRTFPYAISRYEQAPGEVYGRGPAMDVLPAIKVLNEEKKTVLKQGHRIVDPVLLTHDDGILSTMNLAPGAINPGGVNAQGQLMVRALETGNLAVGKEMMDEERAVINDAFLVTLFQILVETPQMTATEVMERTREKGILLAPTVGRQQSEYLGPLVERDIDVLNQQRLLPPMPPLLAEAGGEYRIEYDSPLSRAQRAEEVAGLMRSVESTLQVVNVTQDPAPLDWYDWDKIIPEVAEIQAVPERWMRAKDDVDTLRKTRKGLQEQQTAIQAAPGAAAVMNAAAKNKQAGQ